LTSPIEQGEDVAVSARHIADVLRQRIEAGELRPGDLLPSERDLVAEYGTSKTTARAAMDILRSDGLTESRLGKGVFVRRFKRYDRHGSKRHLRSQRPAGTSPTQAETQAQEIQRELELLDVDTIAAPADVASLLRVAEGAPLVRRRHLITLDGDPAQTADSYFIAEQVEGSRIARHEQIPGGVHSELAAVLGVPLTRAEEMLVARMPTPAEREHLSVLPGTPVVELTRTIYADEQPVEVTRFLFDAGWHRFIYDVPID